MKIHSNSGKLVSKNKFTKIYPLELNSSNFEIYMLYFSLSKHLQKGVVTYAASMTRSPIFIKPF